MARKASIDTQALVSGHFLLHQLEPDELDKLMTFAGTERYGANEVIFRKGDPVLVLISAVPEHTPTQPSPVPGEGWGQSKCWASDRP